MITPSFKTLTVTQLNKYVKSVFDGDRNLKSLFVSGEISNLKVNAFSGHMYFTLKDKDATVRAVMFKNAAERLKFLPKEGMKIICACSVTLYEKDGNYQIYVTDMQPDGVGSISLAFEQLKEKLGNEGLFDASHKKPIPKFPKKIGIITSATGAAVHDMMNVLGRRWPIATLVMCPVSVQGEDAAQQMCVALELLNSYTDCDVLIIGRGGGSAEDLWCFNDESLARTLFNSRIPVISAVGHETDFTICDFVADLRAPTPSAAAEIAVPDINEINSVLLGAKQRMDNALFNTVNLKQKQFDALVTSKQLSEPFQMLNVPSLKLDGLYNRMMLSFSDLSKDSAVKLEKLLSKLEALDPMTVLKRGFAVTEKNGKTVNSVEDLKINDSITLKLSDGSVECSVNAVERN